MEEILSELKEIKELLRTIASNTEQLKNCGYFSASDVENALNRLASSSTDFNEL